MLSFFRKSSYKDYTSHWHDPAAVPLAPILLERPSTSRMQVHWWDAETTRVTGDAMQSFGKRLPACGFFSPSASFALPSADNLPWEVSAAPQSSAIQISQFQTPAIDRVQGHSPGIAQPLKRVLTINRVVGDTIKKRRNLGIVNTPMLMDDEDGLRILYINVSAELLKGKDDPLIGHLLYPD